MTARIFKIYSEINDKIYIGGSKEKDKLLSTILSDYKSAIKKTPNRPSFIEFVKIGLENLKIELLEKCKDDEIEDRKNYYIEQYNEVCINRNREFNTKNTDNEFKNSKIYKITNSIDDYFYIGSTIQLLKTRLSQHKYNTTNRKEDSKNRSSFNHFHKVGVNNLRIECLERCTNINSEEDLKKREDFYISQHINNKKCLNSNHTINTTKEYSRCICGIPVQNCRKYQHINGDRHKNIMEKIQKEGKGLFRCECGIPLICLPYKRKEGLKEHLISRSHKQAMELKEKGL